MVAGERASAGLAALACVEPPRRRRDERFATTESATLVLTSLSDEQGSNPAGAQRRIACRMRDISLGGASLEAPPDRRTLVGPALLELTSAADACALSVPITIFGRSSEQVRVQFANETWIRHALIRKLFTGEYHRDVDQISTRQVFASLTRVLFS